MLEHALFVCNCGFVVIRKLHSVTYDRRYYRYCRSSGNSLIPSYRDATRRSSQLPTLLRFVPLPLDKTDPPLPPRGNRIADHTRVHVLKLVRGMSESSVRVPSVLISTNDKPLNGHIMRRTSAREAVAGDIECEGVPVCNFPVARYIKVYELPRGEGKRRRLNTTSIFKPSRECLRYQGIRLNSNFVRSTLKEYCIVVQTSAWFL